MKRIITTTALMACVVASAFMVPGPATAHAADHGTAGIRVPFVTGTAPIVTNCDGRQEQFQVGGPTAVWVSTNHEAVIQANWASGAVVCDNQTAPSSGSWTAWYLCTPE